MALTNSIKIRGTQNLKLVEVAKEICEYLLNWEIAITAKYLFKLAECSSKLGISKQRMLNHEIFQNVCQVRGFLEIDLLVSRLSHQIPTYVAWKPDPRSHAKDAFLQY